jgi:hypothetical protein
VVDVRALHHQPYSITQLFISITQQQSATDIQQAAQQPEATAARRDVTNIEEVQVIL